MTDADNSGPEQPSPAPQASPSEQSAVGVVDAGAARPRAALASPAALEKLAQWRRNAARRNPNEVQNLLQDARRRLTLLKVFGSAPYLSELSLSYPDAVFEALTSGPSSVIAQAARDLAATNRVSGGADALFEALKPLKQRCDLAIGLAELCGDWGAAEAAAARTDVAERMIEATLHWLARSAYRRGEAQAAEGREDEATFGLFVIAGRRFAHEEIPYFGPLDFLALYDAEALREAGVAAPERTFMRIGAELRQALEGPPSERALYAASAPAVTGLAGAPLICSLGEARSALEGEECGPLRAWFATSRVVAGDRRAGGAFLESLDELLWQGDTSAAEIRAGAEDPALAHDPDAAFERLAQISRLALGRNRALFRTGSMRAVFEKMGEVQAIDPGQAERLAVASDLALMARARLHLITGGSGKACSDAAEREALAAMCGYAGAEALEAALAGARAEAKSVLAAVEDDETEDGVLSIESAGETPYDVGKLEELGFRDGFAITGLIDQWIGVSAGEDAAPRFSELAPGLLTSFGESQAPERAARLFDSLLQAAPEGLDVFAALRETPALQSTVVDFFGVLGAYAQPLAETQSGAAEILEVRGDEAPRSEEEWAKRFAPAWSGLDVAPDLADVRGWTETNFARCALYLASGDVSFDLAPRIAAHVAETALKAVFARCAAEADGVEADAAKRLCLVAAGDLGAGRLAPGAPLRLFFVSDGADPSAAEAFVRRFTAAVDADGGAEGGPAFDLDMSCRPGGVSSALATPLAEFRAYYQSGAVAIEQLLLTGMRPSAGADEARAKVGQAIFDLATRPRKADLILRDADRARARQSRHDRARTDWDVRRISGGLDDIDLIIGALRVKHGGSHAYVLGADPDDCLESMARAGLLDAQHVAELSESRAFWQRIAAAQGFARWSDPESQPISPRLARMLARAGGVDDIAHLDPLMRGHADRVNVLYNHLVLGRERPMDAPLRAAM